MYVSAEGEISITADIAGSEQEEIIVGAKYGYATMKRQTGELKYLKKLWEDPEKGKRYVYALVDAYSFRRQADSDTRAAALPGSA